MLSLQSGVILLNFRDKHHAVKGHFKVTSLFSNASEESQLSHIMVNEFKYTKNVTETQNEETLGCLPAQHQSFVEM